MQPFSKPLMPSHFQAWCEPPDPSGDEILRIVSAQRSLTLKGHSFREFHRHVIPLLDGRRSFEEICAETADLFDRSDLESALSLLAAQNIVVEGDNRSGPPRLQPQLNYFHEVADNADEAQRRLAAAHVVVFGLGGAGASVMHALAAAGVGRVAGVDHGTVSAADTYLSPAFSLADVGRLRAEALAARIGDTAPEVAANAVTAQLSTDEDVAAAIDGADLVISCLDTGMLNLAFKLNAACRARGIPWISGELSGTEVIAGPAFYATDGGPCFMCYRMRLVACAGNPQSRFAEERHWDKMKADAGDKRERLVFGAGLLANLIGAEALNLLTGQAEPALGGRLLSFDLTTLTMQKHVVLRKPGCPVCAGGSAA